MERVVRVSFDRREGDFWVCVPDIGEGNIHLPYRQYKEFVDGDVADIVFEGDFIVSVTLLKEETERRKKDMSSRLRALFERGKN